MPRFFHSTQTPFLYFLYFFLSPLHLSFSTLCFPPILRSLSIYIFRLPLIGPLNAEVLSFYPNTISLLSLFLSFSSSSLVLHSLLSSNSSLSLNLYISSPTDRSPECRGSFILPKHHFFTFFISFFLLFISRSPLSAFLQF